MKYLNIDIKNDSIFKMIYLSEIGRKHMCSIISNLYYLDYFDLIKNMKIYNSEHINFNINNKSSYSDIIYIYKNKIFIIEMNRQYYKKIINKNHFYLFFRHIHDANNDNGYNEERETYLIDIDNYDLNKKLRIKKESNFINHGKLMYEENNISIYKNIHTTRINLDYLKKKKYNYDKLNNIERSCLIFIERDKELLKKHVGVLEKEVIDMLEVVEIDGKYFPLYDKEEFEASLREEAIEQGLEEGMQKGRLEEKLSLAKILKSKNYQEKEIMELTGLSKEEINNL